MIPETVARLRTECGLPVDPSRRGPVPLNQFFEEVSLSHVSLPCLTRGLVGDYLRSEGYVIAELGDPTEKLAGFLFAAQRIGLAFVQSTDILPRRRFTAAHELGHFVLHRATMGSFRADTESTMIETGGEVVDEMEREANQFAAELLMPAEVCRFRAAEFSRENPRCPRSILAYRLASELLVSRQAMRFRLDALEVGHA